MNFVEWWDTFGRARWQSEDARDHKTAAELAWNAATAHRAEQVAQKEPPYGLLVSIALRLDHGLFLKQSLIGETDDQHKRRIEVALSDARKAWEECSGNGFYHQTHENEYRNHLGLGMVPSQLPHSKP